MALSEKPPVYVAADITDQGFINALSNICRDHEQLVTFANFTNVHEWIYKAHMGFLRDIAFAPNASILFSTIGEKHLEARLASTPTDYITAVQEYSTRRVKNAYWVYQA